MPKDFVDLESINIFRHCGDDEYGQGVVQIDARALHQAASGEMERLLLHMAKELDEIASKPYAIVFFNYRGPCGGASQTTDAAGKADYSRIYTVRPPPAEGGVHAVCTCLPGDTTH